MDIVPHDVPVANDTNMPIINIRNGRSAGVIQLWVAPTTNSAVPKSEVTVPIDHANTIITSAGSIVRIPPSNVSSHIFNPMPCMRARIILTTVIAKAPHVKATSKSVLARTSTNETPVEPSPVYHNHQIPTEISATSGSMKFHTLASDLYGSPKSCSTEDNGVEPSGISFPVVSALRSALAIGPKSLPPRIIGTANRQRIA